MKEEGKSTHTREFDVQKIRKTHIAVKINIKGCCVEHQKKKKKTFFHSYAGAAGKEWRGSIRLWTFSSLAMGACSVPHRHPLPRSP